MSKLFCVNCGCELYSHDKFCPACGTQVVQSQTAGNVPLANAYPAQAETAASVPNVAVPAQPPKAKAKSFGWCIWVIVGFVALFFLTGTVFLVRSVVRKSQSAFSSGRGSSSDDSGFVHDLKELHKETKKLKKSWHEDVEVPYEKLKESLKTGSKEDLSDDDSDFVQDLKELHSATKELKRSWNEDEEVPYEKLKEALEKEGYQWPQKNMESRPRRSSAW